MLNYTIFGWLWLKKMDLQNHFRLKLKHNKDCLFILKVWEGM